MGVKHQVKYLTGCKTPSYLLIKRIKIGILSRCLMMLIFSWKVFIYNTHPINVFFHSILILQMYSGQKISNFKSFYPTSKAAGIMAWQAKERLICNSILIFSVVLLNFPPRELIWLLPGS